VRPHLALIGAMAVGLFGAGAGATGALLDQPQDARPVQDPIGDLLRQDTPSTPPATPAPQEPAPTGDPAPAAPIVIIPTAPIVLADVPEVAEPEPEPRVEAAPPPPAKVEEPVAPDRRQRRRVAVVEAVDKITANRMRFEVEVGGRPVRFNRQLVFTARACEVAAPDETIEDAVAYMEIAVEPRATARNNETRQVFRGWMFASSPAVSGLQHPNYDAWVIGCKA